MRFLIFCEDLTENVLEKWPKYKNFLAGNDFPSQIEGSYFLVNEKSKIKLFTFEWFTSKECFNQQLILLNTFDKKNFKWQFQPLKIPGKYQNFLNCPFYVPFTQTHVFLTEIVTKAVAQKMNATLRFLDQEENCWIYAPEVPVLSITTHRVMDSLRHFSTATHDDEYYVLAITPSKPYTNYEKLLLPFDAQIWIFLISTFSFSFLVIFVINQMPARYRHLIRH
jgi:hypothetical protein